MATLENQTYDFICFTDLAYEFNPSQKKEIEKKIRRRLKYHKLGPYNQVRVDAIRQLKNELLREISSYATSVYHTSSASGYADLKDFNLEQMTSDYGKRHDVSKDELRAMINFAVYLFYLR